MSRETGEGLMVCKGRSRGLCISFSLTFMEALRVSPEDWD